MEYRQPKFQAMILQVATDEYLFDGKRTVKYVMQDQRKLRRGTIIRVYRWRVGTQPNEMIIEAYQNLGGSKAQINKNPPWSTNRFQEQKPLNIVPQSSVPFWLKDPTSIYNMTFEEAKRRNNG